MRGRITNRRSCARVVCGVSPGKRSQTPYQWQQGGDWYSLSLFELARMLVRFNLAARLIVNANHGIM
jgi:hypothetical protein